MMPKDVLGEIQKVQEFVAQAGQMLKDMDLPTFNSHRKPPVNIGEAYRANALSGLLNVSEDVKLLEDSLR